MFRKPIITMSLVLPLAMASAVAYAGSTITDKRYWPNEARRTAGHGDARYDQNGAFTTGRRAPRFRIAPKAHEDGHVWRYHGGPKSQ